MTVSIVRTVSLTEKSCKTSEKKLTIPTVRLTIPTIHEPITVSMKVLQTRELLTTLTVLTMIRALVLNKGIGRVIPCGSTAVEELRETRTRPCTATHLHI